MEQQGESVGVGSGAREALEAPDPETAAFCRRVRSGARLAVAAAVAAFAVGLIHAALQVDWSELTNQLLVGDIRPSHWETILTLIVRDVFWMGLQPASAIALSAVVAVVAARMAASGTRPGWAPRLDARFALWASRLCTAMFAAAFLVLVIYSLYMVSSTAQSWQRYVGTGSAPSGFSPARAAGMLFSGAAGWAVGTLKAFFVLLLGSYLVRALLMISIVEPEAAPEDGNE